MAAPNKPDPRFMLVCGASGVGLKHAAKELKSTLGDVDHQDIERLICESSDAENALNKLGVRRRPEDSNWPEMYHITWHLSRDQVKQLWASAARQALNNFTRSKAEHRLLTGHLMYYSGQRGEFYSPVTTSRLRHEDLQPSHLLLLIDDVYDVYLRLTEPKRIFDPNSRLQKLRSRIREEEHIDLGTAPPSVAAFRCLQWQVSIMSLAMSWRQMEMITAEAFASEFESRFLVWGTKQLTAAVAHWLTSPDATSVYLSHPISRPRRNFRRTGSWDRVVFEFNQLQKDLLEHGLVSIMPSAIDEYRIEKEVVDGLTWRRPRLGERWPCDLTGSLYSRPKGMDDFHHRNLIAVKRWDFGSRQFVPVDETHDLLNRADVLLGGLERIIESQVSLRDHLFVAATNGIIVFRPLYSTGTWSDGVKAEIDHWKTAAQFDSSRRLLLIHFDKDVEDLLSIYSDSSQESANERQLKEEQERQLDDQLILVTMQKFRQDIDQTRRIITDIAAGSPGTLLHEGPATLELTQEIAEALPTLKAAAWRNWLMKQLSGDEIGINVPEEQIAVLVVSGMEKLSGNYSALASFLRSGQPLGNERLSRFAKA